MKVYIAGKITGLNRASAELKFQSAAGGLARKGHDEFYPTVRPDYESISYEDYMHICFAMIDICDSICLLDNWQNSEGARMELEYVKDHGKRILFEDEATKE